MSTLDQEVCSVVESFIQNNELFTALDVSNKVKMVMPFARHREVRDIVRSIFATDIQTAGWARTPIQVILEDNSIAEALLYHPVSDTWNLDSKYDAQKRAQAAVHTPSATVAPTIPVPAVVTGTTVTPVPVASIPTPVPVTQTVAQVQARDQWAALFNSAPSLFPRK